MNSAGNRRLTCGQCNGLIHFYSRNPAYINRSHLYFEDHQNHDDEVFHLACACHFDTDEEDASSQAFNFLIDRCCTLAACASILPAKALDEIESVMSSRCETCILLAADDDIDVPPQMGACTQECCPTFSSHCLFEMIGLVEKYKPDGISQLQYDAIKLLVTEEGRIVQPFDVYETQELIISGTLPERDANGLRKC